MKRLNAVLLAFMFAASLRGYCAAQSTTTIRIRFVNGKNGQALRVKSYDHGAIEAGSYKVEKVEGDSMVVTFNDVSTIAFRSSAFDPCDVAKKHMTPPRYSLEEIVSHGVVAPNYCGSSHAQPKAGELTIYSRHQHWWEVTGNVARGLLICA